MEGNNSEMYAKFPSKPSSAQKAQFLRSFAVEVMSKLTVLYLLLAFCLLSAWLLFDAAEIVFQLVLLSGGLAVLTSSLLFASSFYQRVATYSGHIFALSSAVFLTEVPSVSFELKYGLILANYFYLSSICEVSARWYIEAVVAWIGFAYTFTRFATSSELPFKNLVSTAFMLVACGAKHTFYLRNKQAAYEYYKGIYNERKRGEHLWKSLSEATSDGIIVFDQKQIYYVNDTAISIFKKPLTELLGKPIAVLASQLELLEFESKEVSKCIQFPGKYHNDLYELICHYMSSTEDLGVQRLCMSNGKNVFSVFCNSFLSSNNRHYLLSIRDITLMKEIECSRAKSVLLSSLSHELKTPLNAVIDTLKWFLRSLDNVTREGLEIAYTSSQLLYNYVSNVLDYAEYTQGKSLSSRPQRTNIRKTLSKVRLLYEKQIQTCKILFSAIVEDNVPYFLKIDRKRLTQVLINTLGTALRYTYRGCVFLRLSYEAKMLKITINDTGSGLPFSMDPEKLCNVLRDVDPTFCDSGVHMATTQLIVATLGGKMQIYTKAKQGTRIEIIIPAVPTTAIPRSLSLGQVTESYLPESDVQKSGLTYYTNEPGIITGLSTLDEIEEDKCNYRPEEIDEFSSSQSGTFFIPALSPNILPLGTKRTPKRAVSSALPYTGKLLTGTTVAGEQGAKVSKTDEDVNATKLKKFVKCSCPRVLIVDDNALNLFVVESMLRRFGITCDKASNGREAIKMTINSNRCLSCHGYDLIFLDCNMPIMNGFEASSKLRYLMLNGEIRTVPIIANSAFSESDCLPLCEESGMTAFSTFCALHTNNSF